jgi:hypothetical protein
MHASHPCNNQDHEYCHEDVEEDMNDDSKRSVIMKSRNTIQAEPHEHDKLQEGEKINTRNSEDIRN